MRSGRALKTDKKSVISRFGDTETGSQTREDLDKEGKGDTSMKQQMKKRRSRTQAQLNCI